MKNDFCCVFLIDIVVIDIYFSYYGKIDDHCYIGIEIKSMTNQMTLESCQTNRFVVPPGVPKGTRDGRESKLKIMVRFCKVSTMSPWGHGRSTLGDTGRDTPFAVKT